LVKQYVEHFSFLPPKQIVHVRINKDVLLKWEQMVQIYVSIRKFHNKFKVVEEVILHMTDKTTVNWIQCLIGMFSSSVKVKIVNDSCS